MCVLERELGGHSGSSGGSSCVKSGKRRNM